MSKDEESILDDWEWDDFEIESDEYEGDEHDEEGEGLSGGVGR
jgi:hypothetical protein